MFYKLKNLQKVFIMKKSRFFLFLIFVCPILVAQQVTDSTSVALSDVEITTNRNKLYSELGRILIVIDKVEIQRMAVRHIDELLDCLPGLDMRRRGIGVQADVSMRGGSFDQVLILLNGINITDPQTGHHNLNIPINISDISRIEILQGTSARLLGVNAFGGAINIVTEKPTGSELNVQLDGGSFSTYSQSVSAALGSDKIRTFASVTHSSSNGYRENTNYDILNVFSQTSLHTNTAGDFNIQLALLQKGFGSNEFYSFAYPNQFEYIQTLFSALSWELSRKKIQYSAQAYWRQHYDRFELFRNFEGTEAYPWYTGHNYHLTNITGAKLNVSYNANVGKFTFGADIRNEHILSNVLGMELDNPQKIPYDADAFFTKKDSRLITTGLLNYEKTIGKWYFSLGGAAAYNDMFGAKSFGDFDLAYNPYKTIKLFFNANSAVRLPTFTDLYYTTATHISNPDLQPEHAYTLEMGTKINHRQWQTEAVAYYRIGKNIIDWIKYPDNEKWESQNLTEVNALGVDFRTEYHFQHSFVEKAGVSYSYLHMNKNKQLFDSRYALDYLKHKVILTFSHRIAGKLSASWKAAFYDRAGDYTDFVTNEKVIYAPYFLLDTRVKWSQPLFDIYLDANNMLNTEYAEFGGLPQPKFNLNVGVRVRL